MEDAAEIDTADALRNPAYPVVGPLPCPSA
jgi:hypothetical protein